MSLKWLIGKLQAAKQISVEPFLFLFMLAHFVRFAVFQDLLIDRACRKSFADNICNDLNDHDDARTISVRDGNNLYTGVMVASTAPACFMSILLGPWSDMYGRKYTMILATCGGLINYAIDVVITTRQYSSPYLFVASAIIFGLTGGVIITMSATYSYLSDITNERSRPTRLAILEFFFLLAGPLGTVLGGQIYKAAGYITLMCMSPAAAGCALVWLLFVVQEQKPALETATKMQMVRDLFRFDNIKQSFETCVAPRPGNIRLQIWLLIFVSCSVKIVGIGSLGIMFPFAKEVYEWDVTYFSNISTILELYGAVATLTVVPLIYRRFQLHEAALGLVGILSMMHQMVMLSVAFHEQLFYFFAIGETLRASAEISVRSRLSKLVSKQELGRAFSLLATCESVTPVLGTVIMTQVMNASLYTYPGLAFSVSAVLLLPSAFIFAWMTKMPTVSFTEFGIENETAGEELKVLPYT